MKTHLYLGAAAAALLLAACDPAEQTPPAPDVAQTEADAAAAAEAGAAEDRADAAQSNPLLAQWDTPHGAPPFSQFQPEHFVPAFEAAMETHRAEIDAIASNPDTPTFENTMLALENAGADLGRVARVFSNLTSSASNDALDAIQAEMSPRLARHSSAITLNADLFARIDDLRQRSDELNLTPQQARLIEVYHENYVRAGAQLEGEDRERFAEIRAELAGLYTRFAQNERRDSELWTLELSEDDLGQLPSSLASAARAAGQARDLDTPVLTLQRSMMEPFLQQSPNRAHREAAWTAFYNRGNNNNEFDNKDNIRRILELRLELANLLGFETFAHFRTAGTMAGTPDAAQGLMEQVWEPARARALEEQADIEALMTRDGIEDDVMGWDWRYYTEQVRAERFDLDESEVKAYLDLDNMIAAQFYVAERLFGVRFTERTDIETYHDDVRVWEVTRADGGEVVGLFYGDYFARPGKRSGAWMSSFRPQNGITGDIPIIINNCNYNRPAEGAPALISFTDATTLFHELGHGLHGLLSNTEYPSLAGTSVDRDFVEFHAQVMEHWFAEPEVLERFALHYETGEPMPRELLDRVLEAQTFNQGFSTVEFLNSGLVDMAYHRHIDPTSIDVEAFEAEVLARYGSPQAIPMRHRSTHFLHVFSGEGYASGYYSYLWAGVLDNDGFDAFVEAGDIFDPETAARLRAVFSSGNTIPAMDNFINFRGREPSVEPLLRSRGFIEAEG
ncbi:M3 family metallopeptidase [Hyphomonadaceae bacterium BL14]|nr:M3 family metallopeptidase [Hyphomonadaceae bacterium BL14]